MKRLHDILAGPLRFKVFSMQWGIQHLTTSEVQRCCTIKHGAPDKKSLQQIDSMRP